MAIELVCTGGKGVCGLAFDGDDLLHACGQADGRMYVADHMALTPTANTGGAPNCMVLDHTGEPFVCDMARGAVVHMKADGSQEVVVSEYEGRPFRGPHSAVIDSTGQLFFTDAGPAGDTSVLNPRGSCYVVTGEPSSRMLRPLAQDCLAYPTGIALSPSETCVYVCEQSANRVLRFVQRPAGVFHPAVFFQFAGRMGPTAIVCDHSRGGILYVACAESPEVAEKAVVMVLSPEGKLLRELEVPGPEITSLALSLDSKFLYMAESTSNSVYRMLL